MGHLIAPPPAWAEDYLAVPFAARGRNRDGCDCYGLARLVLADRAGIALPEWGDTGEVDNKECQALAIGARRSESPWVMVLQGDERPMDVAEIEEVYKDSEGRFNSAGLHMGVVVAPGWLLHTRANTGPRLERYDTGPLAKAVPWFWRWERLA